jgi:hypothetical protein
MRKIYETSPNTSTIGAAFTSVFQNRGLVTHIPIDMVETDQSSTIYSSDPLLTKSLKGWFNGTIFLDSYTFPQLLALCDHLGGAVSFYNTYANNAVYRSRMSLPIGSPVIGANDRLELLMSDSFATARANYTRRIGLANEDTVSSQGLVYFGKRGFDMTGSSTVSYDIVISQPGMIGLYVWDPNDYVAQIDIPGMDFTASGELIKAQSMNNQALASLGNIAGNYWNKMIKIFQGEQRASVAMKCRVSTTTTLEFLTLSRSPINNQAVIS